MRCFTHRERQSIGVCVACGRGVCEECASEDSDVLSCRNRCEGSAARVVVNRDWGIRKAHHDKSLDQGNRTAAAIGGALMFLTGVIILGYAGLFPRSGGPSLTLAIVFIIVGVISFIASRFSAYGENLKACPRCGYNLKGAAGNRCPECGWRLAELVDDRRPGA